MIYFSLGKSRTKVRKKDIRAVKRYSFFQKRRGEMPSFSQDCTDFTAAALEIDTFIENSYYL